MHCKTLYRTVALAHANKRRGVTPRGYTNAIATACANTPDDSLPTNYGSAFARAFPDHTAG